jgi:transcriptional regulator with XRE-family HTH domain
MGLTREVLAEKADLSDSFLGLVERGTSGLSLESLIAIQGVLKVSFDDLLVMGNEPAPTAETTDKTKLLALIETGTEAEIKFLLVIYKMFKRQGFVKK